MDIIPVARFIFSLFIFGLMYYMFDGVLTTVKDMFYPTGAIDMYGQFLLLMWLALPLINLIVQGVLVLMESQRR